MCPRTAFSSSSIAVWVGHTVCSPCSAYHLARPGSSTRTTTHLMLNLRWAICAITRFVLSPSGDATKASARSMPASSSASISSAVPTVNDPPRSSQLWSCPRLSSAMASEFSSSTETSWPSESMDLATAEPTLPLPTIRTNIRSAQYSRKGGRWARSDRRAVCAVVLRAVKRARRCRGEDDMAPCLLDDVRGGLPRDPFTSSCQPSENGASADATGLLGGQHDRLYAPAARLGDDGGSGRTSADHRRGHLHALVLLPHLLGTRQRPARLVHALGRNPCIQRKRERHLEHVQHLEHGTALPLAGLLGRKAPGGAHDVVVE